MRLARLLARLTTTLRRCWPPFGQCARRSEYAKRRGAERPKWQQLLLRPPHRRMQPAMARALGKLKNRRPLQHPQLLSHPHEEGDEKHLRLFQGQRCLLPKIQKLCQWPVPQQRIGARSVEHRLTWLGILWCVGPSLSVPRGVLGEKVQIEAVCRATSLTCKSHSLGGSDGGLLR